MSDASCPQCPTCLTAEYACTCPDCPACSSDWDDSEVYLDWEIKAGIPRCTRCGAAMRGWREFMRERAELQKDPAWQAEQAQRERIRRFSAREGEQ
jgi:hypothetical protein